MDNEKVTSAVTDGDEKEKKPSAAKPRTKKTTAPEESMTYIRFAAAFSRSGEGAAFLLPGGRRRWPVFPQAVGRYHRQHQQPPQQSPGARRFPVK